MASIVDAWDEAAPDQEDDTQVVELVGEFVNCARVVGESVKGSGHPKTCRGSKKEATEDKGIFCGCCLVLPRKNSVQDEASSDGHNRSEHVRVYVDCFVVQMPQAGCGFGIGVRRRPITTCDEDVVLLP